MPASPPNVRFPGLTVQQVQKSLATHGENILTPPPRDPWWVQWLSKFEDPVIRILIVAAFIQIAVGIYKEEYLEGIAIVAAILLATTLAFVNEYKANREFDVLNLVNDDVSYKVIRAGQFAVSAKRKLVVGDVVILEPGEEIPADGEVLEATSLAVSEASLTGEAVPVEKLPLADVKPDNTAELRAYPQHIVNRGTLVADGHGFIRLTATGDRTELGKLGEKAGEETHESTPLNEQLDKLAKWIGIIGLGIATLTFIALVARGAVTGELALTGVQWLFAGIVFIAVAVALHRVWLKILWEGATAAGIAAEPPAWLAEDTAKRWLIALGMGVALFGVLVAMSLAVGGLPTDVAVWYAPIAVEKLLNYFMIAVVIIVVAVPEGLAMSVTLSLAYSMRKMTAQQTLVRKMHACETIGAATIICSDKTGTLTQNKMTVMEARFPTGMMDTVTTAIAANTTAQLSREQDTWKVLGNPTDGALLLWLQSQNIDYLAARSSVRVLTQLPFSTERKLMATLVANADGVTMFHVKGAPEAVLLACVKQVTSSGNSTLTTNKRDEILSELKQYQQRGMRTIGFAVRADVPTTKDLPAELHDLAWLGFTAIADPVRTDVPDAVAACRAAGIQVKIVTGDTAETAREIGRQIGLIDGSETDAATLTGPEFAALSDDAALLRVAELKILARARPLDKLRLVRLLQSQREVVAVTGDGTNDAPALNYAKVGLAMGQSGTATAKEAADIVLLDDSFKSIVTAVKWGRGLYENIQRFILFQLTINVVALGIALIGPFAGVDFPLTVMQMLWVNLIMDTFAALALATEPPQDNVMNRKPRHAEAFIITPSMAKGIVSVGLLFLVGLLALLMVLPHDAEGLTIFFSVFVLLQFWNLFNARCLGTTRSALSGFFANPAFLGIAAAILIGQILLVQFGGSIFRTVPLDALTWAKIILGTLPVLVIGEVWRARQRRTK